MSRKASPTLIGAFVVGAVVLSVLAAILLGADRYFRKTYEFVLYFGGSVNGLHVGAPVKFKGVEVGTVKDIRLQLDSSMDVERIPVVVELDPRKITSRGYTYPLLNDPRLLDGVVKRGLRGQLKVESFVTGVLFVALDMFPNTPITYVQQTGRRRYRYREIPTVPNPMERVRGAADRILARLADTDFESFVDSATRTVAAINELVSSPELRAAVRSSGDVTRRLADATARISGLATRLDGQVDSLAGDMHVTAAMARAAIQHADEAITRTDATINDSPTRYELDRTLQELSAAARSLRLLASYLERNPGAPVFGRPVSKEER
jgi:paraquat-inducible protein B